MNNIKFERGHDTIMELREKLDRLNDLHFDETIELIKKYYLYVKPNDKESFFKSICSIADKLCSEGALASYMKDAINKYKDLDFLAKQEEMPETNHKDDVEDINFFIKNLIKYNYVNAAVARVFMRIVNPNDRLARSLVDMDCIMTVLENCDMFTTPEEEDELCREVVNFIENNKSKLYAASINKTVEQEIVDKFLNILKPYLKDFSFFHENEVKRTSFQWFDKRHIKECLRQLNKNQLIDFYHLIITYRKRNHLFMSKSSVSELINSINPVYGNAICASKKSMKSAFEKIDKNLLIKLLYDHADMNLILWDNALDALIQSGEIRTAYAQVEMTLALQNRVEGTNIDVLV